MKRYLNWSIFYAFAGLAAGVFYREFTKINQFTNISTLGKVHGHLLLLGMVMFLIVALFSTKFDLEQAKHFSLFMILYNGGLILSAIMMIIRGILQVKAITLSAMANGMISGIAGLGHMAIGIGLLIFLFILRKLASDQ
ncbi:DUF2871 domain-containing protein [Dubosiella newyorkensis]|uniref:DUF2871 domain-containing protein n=1 Tax=Dubosiella newyorkensis TaxID=1862672 RepID=UPI00272CEC2A|nr:DUF2871 domain-containing protein [Dubosiella newyorkensis]